MLELVPNHLKTRTLSKYTVNKLPFLIKYFPDQQKTQRMCDKVILKNGGMLMFITDCYKQNMCNRAVDNYAHVLGSVLDCYKT